MPPCIRTAVRELLREEARMPTTHAVGRCLVAGTATTRLTPDATPYEGPLTRCPDMPHAQLGTPLERPDASPSIALRGAQVSKLLHAKRLLVR